MSEENKLIKQDNNKKYLVIGIILLVIMGILWIIGNVDFSKDKEVRVQDSNIINADNSNSSNPYDIFNIQQYIGQEQTNIIRVIISITVFCLAISFMNIFKINRMAEI